MKKIVLGLLAFLPLCAGAQTAVDVIRGLDRNSYVELNSTVANKIFFHFSPLPFIEGMKMVKVNGENHFLITSVGLRPDVNPTGVKLVNAKTGELAHEVTWKAAKRDYSDDPFGEGVALFHGNILHISFTPGLGYLLDFASFLNDTAQELIDYARSLPYTDLPSWDANGNVTSVVTKFTSVTNGVTVDDEGNLYQGGKNWNRVYQLNIIPPPHLSR